MKNNRKLVSRVKRILEEKNNKYRRKMYMMSFLSESNIKNSKDLMSEAYCLIRALNNSNGEFPKEDYILEFYKRSLDYTKFPKHVSNSRVKYVKKSADLRFNNTIDNTTSLINEILDSINISDKKINRKLEKTLLESFVRRTNILTESSDKVIDLTKMFDTFEPEGEALAALEARYDSKEGRSDDLGEFFSDDEFYDDDFDFDFGDDDEFSTEMTQSDIAASFGGKDPAKMRPNQVAKMFKDPRTGKPYESEKYYKDRKSPIYSAWDKLVQDSMKKIITGYSVEAKRKWWIIGAIKTNIVLQKSALKFLGLTEKQKANMLTPDEYDAAMDYYSGKLDNETVAFKVKGVKGKEDTDVLTLAKQGRILRNKDKERKSTKKRSGRNLYSLDEFEIKEILDDLQTVLAKGDFNLESEDIKEYDLLEILSRATRPTPDKFKQFIGADSLSDKEKGKKIGDLDIMYPLKDQESLQASSDELIPKMGDEDYKEYVAQHLDDIRKAYEEDQEMYKGEIDTIKYDEEGNWVSGTGQPIFARDEDIKKIREKIAAEKSAEEEDYEEEEILSPITGEPILQAIKISPEEYMTYEEGRQEDLKRLKELVLKEEGVPENIFRKFKDKTGASDPDPEQKKGVALTPSEAEEKEEIIERLMKYGNVTLVDPKNKKLVYDMLMKMGASPEEFEEFVKMYGLDSSKPRRWDEIAMASMGAWKRTAGSRQYGIKAWMRGVFFGMSPSEKADIYSQIGEKWFERIEVNDLISDESKIPESDRAIKMDTDLNTVSLEDLSSLARRKGYPQDQIEEIGKSWSILNIYSNFIKEFIEKGPTRKQDDNDEIYQRKKDAYIKKIVERVIGYSKRINLYDDLAEIFQKIPNKLTKKKIESYLLGGLEEKSLEVLTNIYETSSSEDEEERRITSEFDNNPEVKELALMKALMEDTSGFRIFANTLLKEFYNRNIWPGVEEDLAFGIKEYFQKNFPGSDIGKSLNRGEKSDKVKPEEGKELFDTVIYLAMQRVGMDDSEQRMATPGQGSQEDNQRRYFHGEGKGGSKGDFAAKVKKFNEKYPQNKIVGSGPNGEFSRKDVDDLVDDIFDKDSGILGQISNKLKIISKSTVAEVIAFIQSYNEQDLDKMIPNAMIMSMALRKGANPMNIELFKKLGKETSLVVDKYKKDFGEMLTDPDFVEMLEDDYGYGAVNPELSKKGRDQPTTKSML